MSIVNGIKGFVRTISGKFPLTLPHCVDGKSIIDYKIYGNSVQNGTPSPTNYVEVESVGDYDEETGKYKVPIFSDGQLVTSVLLNEPLYKVGSYADYIDFENKKVIRKVGIEEFTSTKAYGVYSTTEGFSRTMDNMKTGRYQDGLCTYYVNEKKFESKIRFGAGNTIIYFDLPEVYKLGTNRVSRQEALAKWLKALEKPFIVYYILAEETVQSIELPNIPTFKGDTILTVGTTTQPSNAGITYYSTEKGD